MKKIVLILITVFFIAGIAYPYSVSAQQFSPSAKGAPSGDINENQSARVKKIVGNRVEEFKKVMDAESKILDKLQTLLDKTKGGGKDVSSASSLMADARAKITDAKIRLDDIEAQKDTVTERSSLNAIVMKFKMIRENLYTVRKDMIGIVNILKNSSKK